MTDREEMTDREKLVQMRELGGCVGFRGDCPLHRRDGICNCICSDSKFRRKCDEMIAELDGAGK